MNWKELKEKCHQVGQDIVVLTTEGAKEFQKEITPALMKAGVQTGFAIAKAANEVTKGCEAWLHFNSKAPKKDEELNK